MPDRIERVTGGSHALGEANTKRVEVSYRLPKNAGNLVANEATKFDLDLLSTRTQPTPE